MRIGIAGLGYVGLPLACLFASKYEVIGFDIDATKIKALAAGIDSTGQLELEALKQVSLSFTNHSQALQKCDVIIVTVPTDIDAQNQPDLSPLKSVSASIGKILQPGMIVVYESTVYPGLTEEICIPILALESGLVWKKDFHVGYSPERINPGDKKHPLSQILKIVSADTPATLSKLSNLYGSVIEAGIYEAPDIKTAEAAKVIENAQRDLNIAFMNELAVIFDRMNIDTRAVIKAATTKWNFLPFEPGLVGGHCIGVDPYYLTFKAEQLGYSPQVIHSGRHLNNNMGKFIAEKVVKLLIVQEKVISKCKVLILGCAFKENIGDTRNSRVFDIYSGLQGYHIAIDFVDPLVNDALIAAKGLIVEKEIDLSKQYDAIILAVKHDIFVKYPLDLLKTISVLGQLNLFDVKAFYNREEALATAKYYWRL